MLPNFLVIGAMKAGTTSLWAYLQSHPQVVMAHPKEPHFFSRNWELGLAWYEQHFEDAAETMAVGEASTSYTRHPHEAWIPGRIAEFLPKARLIYLVRHPIERMRSHYLHNVLSREERRPIAVALLTNPVYLDVSSYAMQIDQYLPYFPKDRLLVITSEALLRHRTATLRRVFEFLEVDPAWDSPELELHRTATKWKRHPGVHRIRRLPGYGLAARLAPQKLKERYYRLTTMRPDLKRGILSEGARSRLEDLLRNDVRRLRAYLDPDFDGWGIA
jgi:hypothetical protein